ncbi:twin-arginine translocation pathway signal peptide [Cryptococcus deuterogattii 99/473]|uniref:Twin-arginine translocation pathway signal peptide n=1 Tax=Cryptococcus deuterogattii Ram5 TaxID=1296110 RepID=A0A0D0V562_9TREE|nr:twin-arginine translocation pathway signal peptide [Cryptococcus deuterogattii LA55]KIR33483.1 twin-arginine translocation pathway signal peptide [Cryptococcus deuterogattii MMRL2647]KIR41774.1 twin-arginine translocation pathway signal peptide [Cryptococcus deuterogattii Ram5]KIR73402.1 twin-arginine translocation pathway signal peptide [Cryptococcus deuterogattii CA1014]KIR91737.1 twin-arginine translocation pathway signal peptide [Cryptococcus deuterogattii CBS 10090]KIY60112.1 twin-argi
MGMSCFASPAFRHDQQGTYDGLLGEDDLPKKSSEPSFSSIEEGPKSTRPVPTLHRRIVVAVLFLVIFMGALKYTPSLSLLDIIASLSTSDSSSLSAAFNHKCEALLTPPPKTYSNRLDSLVSELPQSTVWIAEPGPSASYFIGAFSTQDWQLSERPFLVAIGRSPRGSPRIFLVTPEFEALRASLIKLPRDLDGSVIWVKWREDQNPYEALKTALGYGVDAFILDGLTRQFVAEGLRSMLREEKDDGVLKEIGLIRERKSLWEVELLRCANQKTLHAIRKTKKRMYLGISESQTSRILEHEMAKTGLMGGGGLVLFGDVRFAKFQNSTLPHRALGSTTFAQLDKAARGVVDSWIGITAGTDTPNFDVFTHRLGHGIGLEGHESPYLVQGSLGERQVRSGHVFSLEPGIYLPVNGKTVNGINGVGVRLEDCFVVTEDEDGSLKGEWLSGPVQSWGDV